MGEETRGDDLIKRMLQTPISRRSVLLGATGVAAGFVVSSFLLERISNNTRAPEIHTLTAEQQQQVQELFEDCYNGLKQNYLVDGGEGALRTIYDQEKQDTDAEVQAYSMLAAVKVGDHETFDKLWSYQKRYRNNQGTISWLMDRDGHVVGEESAFDSTQDTAAALILAHRNGWKGGYEHEAKDLLQNSMKVEIESQTFIPKGGSYGGGSEFTNPSYYDPYAYEELFAGYDKNWLRVAAACREVMDRAGQKIQQGTMKSFPDWVDASGQPVAGVENTPHIGYDSTRIALRQLQGALHLSGENKQHAMKQLSLYNALYESIVSKGGGYDMSRIVDGYSLNGKPTGRYPFTCFASAAVAASLASPNKGYREYMFSQLPFLQSQHYPFNYYMLLNTLRLMCS